MKTTVQIDKETHAKLKKIAEASRMTLGDVIKHLVEAHRGAAAEVDYDEQMLEIK